MALCEMYHLPKHAIHVAQSPPPGSPVQPQVLTFPPHSQACASPHRASFSHQRSVMKNHTGSTTTWASHGAGSICVAWSSARAQEARPCASVPDTQVRLSGLGAGTALFTLGGQQILPRLLAVLCSTACHGSHSACSPRKLGMLSSTWADIFTTFPNLSTGLHPSSPTHLMSTPALKPLETSYLVHCKRR